MPDNPGGSTVEYPIWGKEEIQQIVGTGVIPALPVSKEGPITDQSDAAELRNIALQTAKEQRDILSTGKN